MLDRDLLIAKAASVRAHLDQITCKAGDDLQGFVRDADRQEIVAFNLHLAVENCIDIAAHIISENGWGVPGNAISSLPGLTFTCRFSMFKISRARFVARKFAQCSDLALKIGGGRA